MLHFYGEFIHGAAKELVYTPGVVLMPVWALVWECRRQALNRWGGSGIEKKKCIDGISLVMQISSLCLSFMESIKRCLAVCWESALDQGLSNQTTYVARTETEPFSVEWRDQILSWGFILIARYEHSLSALKWVLAYILAKSSLVLKKVGFAIDKAGEPNFEVATALECCSWKEICFTVNVKCCLKYIKSWEIWATPQSSGWLVGFVVGEVCQKRHVSYEFQHLETIWAL